MIVLVNLPPATPEMPPSGLSYLSGAIGSRYYDMNLWLFHNMDKTKWYEQDNEFWLNTLPQSRLIERYARFLAGLKADTYGFSGNKFSIPIFQKTAKYLKAWQKTHIVLGGSAVTSAITLPEADCMFHGDNFDEFIKVSKKKTRGIVSCSLANISAIPHPRYCNLTKHTTATVPIFFSKGCTKTCKFCADKITYCRRPEEEIVKEILYIVKRFKVNRFYVCDLIINNDIGYLASLAQKLASLPVKLRFTGSATMDKRMDFGFFRLLRKAGFHELCFGVESLSDNVLHLMGKDYSAADAMANIKDAKMAGLSTQVNFMVGFPGEHDEDIGITIEKLEDCNSYIDNVSNLNICSLEPGAPILAGDLTGFYDTKKEMEWTFDGNTLEERQKRRERLMAACEKNNLTPSWTQNIMPKESI